MEILIYIFSFLLLVSVIVFLHELGHYYFAKRYGVKVTRFLICGLPFFGLDKELIGWTDKSGTRWSIGYFPLGGFVDFFGSNDMLLNQEDIKKKYSSEDQKFLLQNKKTYQKVLFAFGGPLANFLTAIIIFSFISIFIGKDFSPAIVSGVTENSPAQKAGILTGDKIIKINGHEVVGVSDVSRLITISLSDSIGVSVERNGAKEIFNITPMYIEDDQQIISRKSAKRKVIGISLAPPKKDEYFEKLGPSKAIYYAVKETVFLSKYILIHLGNLIIGKADLANLSGPIGIAQVSGELIKIGFIPFLLLMAHLSVSLGLLNLLPIPVLDGGHIMFFTLEKILGRPLKKETLEFLFRIGMSLLIMLMFFTFYIDIINFS